MATTVTIDGAPVTPGRAHVPRRLARPIAGVDTYVFEVRGGSLPADDPILGKEVTVTVNGTLRFKGDVARADQTWRNGVGWVRVYSCHGLRARGDRIPHRDRNTGGPNSTYNATRDSDETEYLASRAGREVGEILADVLTTPANATALDALGIGAYTTLSPPTLPTATVNDLDALDRVLPGPIRFGGEKLLTALDGILSACAPNHKLTVEPDGTLRIRNTRAFANKTVTLGAGVPPPSLSRDVGECFTAVQVEGMPLAETMAFALSDGTLDEDDFAYDGLTVAQAKAAFRPEHYQSPGCVDEGDVTCDDTTHVTVTSDDPGVYWSADFWNQTAGKRYGTILLTDTVATGIEMKCQRMIVDSNALTAGGSAQLTLDRALPSLTFDRYILRGRRGGRENVYAVYGLPAWAGPKVAPKAAFSYPLRNASGGGVIQVSTAMGHVLWSASGNPPYFEVAVPVEVDPDAGAVVFTTPTWIIAGNREPSDVRAYIPIYNATNTVRKPASGYEGIAHSADGIDRVLTVHVPTWRDPANLAGMGQYAQDLLDSVKDPIIEGSVTILDLDDDLLDHGNAIVIESPDMVTTPWEDTPLPVTEIQLEWITSPGEPGLWRTTLGVSTRRAHFTEAAYLSPDRTGVTLDFGGSLDMTGTTSHLPDPNAIIANMLGMHGQWLASQAAAGADALASLGPMTASVVQGVFGGAAEAVQNSAAAPLAHFGEQAEDAGQLLREGHL